MDDVTLVDLDDVRQAAERLAGHVVRTPLVPCPWAAGAELYVKPESLQPTGAFKLRGALNALAELPAAERERGVVTHSSGNHGRALAWAAREYGVPAVVVMPDNAPEVKLAGVRALGAEVLLVPAADRAPAVERLRSERGLTFVPPFDHPSVIAGQGTIGLELASDLDGIDTVLVPVAGGGLLSGIAVAVKALQPQARVVGVEPELAGDLAAGFAAGRRVEWDPAQTGRTIADAVRVPAVGPLAWRHIERFVDDVVTVAEEEILEAVAVLATSARLVAEPAGALPVAAVRSRAGAGWGRTVAVVSGGNIEPGLLASVVGDHVAQAAAGVP